jgi:hypothetical protein
MKPAKAKRKTKWQHAEADEPLERLRASLTRLQDPDYVVSVIKECQERGMIPKDFDPERN